MRPLKDRILVQLDEHEQVTPGGIIIPDNAKEIAFSGKVLFAGKDVKEVKVGDRVFIGQYVGIMMEYKGKECVILKEDDTLAIIEDK